MTSKKIGAIRGRHVTLTFIGILGITFLFGLFHSVEANRSGCYAQHSCPSDTGSYVCGDTGDCSQCPDGEFCLDRQRRTDQQPSANTTSSTAYVPPDRTKTTGCAIANGLQDPACTPGAVFATATVEMICKSGYSKTVRNVPDSVKNEAYREYGIVQHTTGQYEVDHLISLELGGSNDIANLWPEQSTSTPDSLDKDKVENYLHKRICDGKMTLKEAQEVIATNWLKLWPLPTI